jgi:hypothetical protein
VIILLEALELFGLGQVEVFEHDILRGRRARAAVALAFAGACGRARV